MNMIIYTILVGGATALLLLFTLVVVEAVETYRSGR